MLRAERSYAYESSHPVGRLDSVCGPCIQYKFEEIKG